MDRYLGTTKEQLKMARHVAADVLVTMRYLDVRTGSYCTFRPSASGFSNIYGKSIQKVSTKDLKNSKCRVCAKGMMFISRCRLYNEYKIESADMAEAVLDSTKEDFGGINSSLIENSFERGEVTYLGPSYRRINYAALIFGRWHTGDRKRLRAIMKNVIEHKGVFRPDKDPRVIKFLAKEKKEYAKATANAA